MQTFALEMFEKYANENKKTIPVLVKPIVFNSLPELAKKTATE